MAPLILARIRKGSHILLRMALNWLSVQASDSSTSSQEQSVTVWLICKPLDLLYLTSKVSIHSGVASINLSPFEVKPNHFSYTDTSLPLKVIPDSARGTNKCEYYPYIQKLHFFSVHFSCRVLVLYPTNYRLLCHRNKQMSITLTRYLCAWMKLFNLSLGSHVHYWSPLTVKALTQSSAKFFSSVNLEKCMFVNLTAILARSLPQLFPLLKSNWFLFLRQLLHPLHWNPLAKL